MNQHIIPVKLEASSHELLFLSELSSILELELPLTGEIELDLHFKYDNQSQWHRSWYNEMFIQLFRLYQIPENKKGCI